MFNIPTFGGFALIKFKNGIRPKRTGSSHFSERKKRKVYDSGIEKVILILKVVPAKWRIFLRNRININKESRKKIYLVCNFECFVMQKGTN